MLSESLTHLKNKLAADAGKSVSWADMHCSDHVLDSGIAVVCRLLYGTERFKKITTYEATFT